MIKRFKKVEYAGDNTSGDVPRWHIAAADYQKGEAYRKYVALCGYEIKSPWLKDVALSFAKKVAGPQCKKCIAKAAAK